MTRVGMDEMRRVNVEDWGCAVMRRVWRLAGHMSRRADGRWGTAVLDWIPEGGARAVGRPEKRWGDDIRRFLRVRGGRNVEGRWRELAADREGWKRMGEDFERC